MKDFGVLFFNSLLYPVCLKFDLVSSRYSVKYAIENKTITSCLEHSNQSTLLLLNFIKEKDLGTSQVYSTPELQRTPPFSSLKHFYLSGRVISPYVPPLCISSRWNCGILSYRPASVTSIIEPQLLVLEEDGLVPLKIRLWNRY